jgi:hypothetical protein
MDRVSSPALDKITARLPSSLSWIIELLVNRLSPRAITMAKLCVAFSSDFSYLKVKAASMSILEVLFIYSSMLYFMGDEFFMIGL